MKLKKSTLILGIGNYLMGDEGIGVHVANVLEKYNPFDGVAILDGGTGGFHLLEYFEKYEHVILVDATLDGNVPGTIRQIKPRFAIFWSIKKYLKNFNFEFSFRRLFFDVK